MLAALLTNPFVGRYPEEKHSRDRRPGDPDWFARTDPPVEAPYVDLENVKPRRDARTLIEKSRTVGLETEMARAILDDDEEAMMVILMAIEA